MLINPLWLELCLLIINTFADKTVAFLFEYTSKLKLFQKLFYFNLIAVLTVWIFDRRFEDF